MAKADLMTDLHASTTIGVPTVKEGASSGVPPPTSGFPIDGSSIGFWLRGVQNDPLLHHRTTAHVPATADIVIIGSGITGTVAAKHCVETWPDKKVVVVEAREFCSGATGRNAGHCKPDQWRGFTKYQQAFGTEQALKIMENEQQTWSSIVNYVRTNNVDCDLWVGDTCDVPMTQEAAKTARDTFDALKAAGGTVENIKVTHCPEEAEKLSGVKGALARYSWSASTLYPWKLAAHVMRKNLDKGVNLQTGTKVLRISESPDKQRLWVVETARGEIRCQEVIHATNAYCSALEPSMQGLVRPQPHMCDAFVSPSEFLSEEACHHSFGILFGNDVFYSINPRSTTPGVTLFGGSNPGQAELEKWLQEHPDRYIDDGLLGFKPVTRAARDFAELHLKGWNEGTRADGKPQGASWSGLISMISQLVGWNKDTGSEKDQQAESWSGIIAISPDGVPFVGPIPDKLGQWICAGHNGHGMARAFTAAPALVKLMNGQPWSETHLPEVFELTRSRAERLKSAALQ